jgi:hypothetical protein
MMWLKRERRLSLGKPGAAQMSRWKNGDDDRAYTRAGSVAQAP